MIGAALSAAYGAVATWRRRWYAGRPSRRVHLSQPVISVGNLRVGGSGKTPATACIAQLLVEHGEHPAVLSRGYARQHASTDVTVVSDRSRVLADVAHAGDEPLLLAQSLPGVPVLVCADRHRAGRVAETQCGATVHILDDGFQHVGLARDIDIILADASDLTDRVLPGGRLREPLANASVAHAVIVPGVDGQTARGIAEQLGVAHGFVMTRALGPASALPGSAPLAPDASVFAVAGIARPERFFDDLRTFGVKLAGTRVFPDHHQFTQRDIASIVDSARGVGATSVVVTEKDAVRLTGLDLSATAFAAVPLLARIEPAEAFATWLLERLARARANRTAARS
ncbi:MAG: tetraacyldisaccharide 4'-kinase [Vicinamibacterales bacterium]